MKKTTLILFACLTVILAQAQDAQLRTVSGFVCTLGNIACSGIEVTADKAGTTATTDSLGRFSIQCQTKDKLVFKSRLFNKKYVKIRPGTPDDLQVELQFDGSTSQIDLAVGYGYIREEDRTEAVAQLKQRNGYCSYHDIYDIFRGKFAGVTVQGTSIIIRGTGSVLADNSALVIVNGVPYSGDLSSISPCDIGSISILKDAAAAIYGTRGANGVVVIELDNKR